MTDLISPKDAAIQANAHQTLVYAAIHNGKMRARRERGRIFILRDSFEQWKQRLNQRRELKEQEAKLISVRA